MSHFHKFFIVLKLNQLARLPFAQSAAFLLRCTSVWPEDIPLNLENLAMMLSDHFGGSWSVCCLCVQTPYLKREGSS